MRYSESDDYVYIDQVAEVALEAEMISFEEIAKYLNDTYSEKDIEKLKGLIKIKKFIDSLDFKNIIKKVVVSEL